MTTDLTPFRLSRVALAVAVLGTAFGALQAAMLYAGLQAEQMEGGLPFVVSFPRIMVWQASSWLVWGALAPAVLVLGARWTPERPLLFLAVHLPAGLTAGTLHAAADLFLNRAVRPFGQGAGRPAVSQLVGHITNSLNVELLVYFVILGAGYALDYYRRFRDRELRAAQLEGRLAEARLEALRLQLQPHFLFNALHTVAGLVRQGDNPAAVEMLARLSDLLRATLEGGGRPLVPLRRELALAELYLAIQQVRFADRLRIERAIDPALLDAAVPPFVLQPLLENAVRHGLAVRAGAGALRIVAERSRDRLLLAVEDDGRGLGGTDGGGVEGVGLGNTRARLAQLFGDEARLELVDRPAGGAIARLTLPVLLETPEAASP